MPPLLHERRLLPPHNDNDRVRNYRIMRAFSQANAAEHHGVSERTWQRWERPGTHVPPWVLKQIVTWARRACPTFLPYVSFPLGNAASRPRLL
jgi:DNA-binding XRE family transcriptional regulator